MRICSRRKFKMRSLLPVVTWWFIWNGQVGPFTTSEACVKVVQALFLGSDCDTSVGNVCFSNTGLTVQVPESCTDAAAACAEDSSGAEPESGVSNEGK